jgi:PIN domain nuclease of toxin-antitoxin system
VRLLLDTHVLIWWTGDQRLSETAAAAISSPENSVFVSAASVWEAEIKAAGGKLNLGGDLVRGVDDSGFTELPVRFEHGRAAAHLPMHHRDPFDRMLIAQARIEGLTVVTRDPAFSAYDVPLLPG